MADVSKLYEKAKDYLDRKNFGPAIDLFQQVLAMDPDYAPARRDVRKAEIRKYEAQGYPPKALVILLNLPNLLRLSLLGLSKNHDRFAMVCEDILARDPRNVAVSLRLGASLWEAGHNESALAAYEAVLDFDPVNTSALVACGDLARNLGDLQAAIQYFQRAQKTDPRNKHVTDSIRDISAMISIQPREKAGSFRDLVREEVQLEEERPRTLDERIAEARERTTEDPADADAWCELADKWQEKGNAKEALSAMEKAAKARPDDNDLRIRLGDMKIAFLDKRIAAIDRKLAEGDDESLASKKEEAEKKKLALEVQEYTARTGFYPTDLGLRFRLGDALFRAGRLDDAIAAFQQSKKDPKRSRDSAYFLGRCFLAKERYKMAVNQFESAMDAGGVLDVRGKETLYYLGKARMGEGDREGALKDFETLYEEDIHFRDVADLLEELG